MTSQKTVLHLECAQLYVNILVLRNNNNSHVHM